MLPGVRNEQRTILTSPWFIHEVSEGLLVGFTDATAGNLALHVGDLAQNVAINRGKLTEQLEEQLGAPLLHPLQFMNQVHDNHVEFIEGERALAPTADAMVSRDVSLAVMVADCVPVVMVGRNDKGHNLLAVAHAGRPGVEKDVISNTITAMKHQGASRITAWVGPSVCGKCYEVPDAMRAAVAAVEPAAYSTTSWDTPALDLPAAVVAQLERAQVDTRNVGICTLENTNFYSHRRAVRDGEAEGRFIGFAITAQSSGLS